MQEDGLETDKQKMFLRRLEDRYYEKFLPLVYSKSYAKQFLNHNLDDFRLWESSKDKILISLPPPPTIKENPEAKPQRLGRVIKRLAWCYQQPLNGKTAIAKEVLGGAIIGYGQSCCCLQWGSR